MRASTPGDPSATNKAQGIGNTGHLRGSRAARALGQSACRSAIRGLLSAGLGWMKGGQTYFSLHSKPISCLFTYA